MDVTNEHIAEATLEVTVIRKDGTVENLGVVDAYTRPQDERGARRAHGREQNKP